MRYFENYISPHFKGTLVKRLTPEMTQIFVDSLIGRGLSAVTVQSVFSFFRNGIKTILPNATLAVRLPKKQPNKVEVLSMDEQKRLEAVANNF